MTSSARPALAVVRYLPHQGYSFEFWGAADERGRQNMVRSETIEAGAADPAQVLTWLVPDATLTPVTTGYLVQAWALTYPPAQKPTPGWNCVHCNGRNFRGETRCGMCGKRRPEYGGPPAPSRKAN